MGRVEEDIIREAGNRKSNVIHITGKKVGGRANWGVKRNELEEAQGRIVKESKKWQHSIIHMHEDAMMDHPFV